MFPKSRASGFWDLETQRMQPFLGPCPPCSTRLLSLPPAHKGRVWKTPCWLSPVTPSTLHPAAGLLFFWLPVGGEAVPSVSSRDLPSLQLLSRVCRPRRLSPEFQSSLSPQQWQRRPNFPTLLKLQQNEDCIGSWHPRTCFPSWLPPAFSPCSPEENIWKAYLDT